MSQSIALIIAATVLMMTALIAIFIVKGGLSDTGTGISNSGCLKVVQAKCSGGGSISAPATCFDSEGNAVGVMNGHASSVGASVECQTVLGGG